MSDWARFWAVDLHVHTPGSQDVKPENFGTAADIVQAALDAGLDGAVDYEHTTDRDGLLVGGAAEDAAGAAL